MFNSCEEPGVTGIDLRSLPPGTELVVDTRNSRYRLVMFDGPDSNALVQGGRYFRQETEARITKPLEEVINTVTGIDELRSTTLEGVSRIMVQFKLDRDINSGVQDVRDKISTVLDQLPDGTKPPLVAKWDMDSLPILTFTVTGYQSMKELTEIGRRMIKEPLESVDGDFTRA